MCSDIKDDKLKIAISIENEVGYCEEVDGEEYYTITKEAAVDLLKNAERVEAVCITKKQNRSKK